ncbi:nucleotidyltransferase family protein [Aequorivita echinoideorum]|uniref:Nucleotidyltransferase family protein n=1 Tax=Aequorivita echinoideorum TaxID=1549647 RepID=A0ABS5S8A4_9FLAO|nr:nucleotidyltransferase family protein [Aequorivita echinoideorum]MBT0608110.1 nucleotidyltransferase family protein [Aequorivita echinoideorum]
MKKIGIIILAAGASKRMKRKKQMLPFKETTLLGNALEIAKMTSASRIICVLGAHFNEILNNHNFENIEVLENKNWEQGLGSSLAVGTEFLQKKHHEIDGILIMLADQPFVNSAYLNKLINTFSNMEEGILATNYSDHAGVPAIFPRKFYTDLNKLKGDEGAKSILQKYTDSVKISKYQTDTTDIDTPAAYENAIKQKTP